MFVTALTRDVIVAMDRVVNLMMQNSVQTPQAAYMLRVKRQEAAPIHLMRSYAHDLATSSTKHQVARNTMIQDVGGHHRIIDLLHCACARTRARPRACAACMSAFKNLAHELKRTAR